jgi:hypothetical protein
VGVPFRLPYRTSNAKNEAKGILLGRSGRPLTRLDAAVLVADHEPVGQAHE